MCLLERAGAFTGASCAFALAFAFAFATFVLCLAILLRCCSRRAASAGLSPSVGSLRAAPSLPPPLGRPLPYPLYP